MLERIRYCIDVTQRGFSTLSLSRNPLDFTRANRLRFAVKSQSAWIFESTGENQREKARGKYRNRYELYLQ